MKMHTITVEIDERKLNEELAEELVEGLAHIHPAVGQSDRGWVSITVSLPAEHVSQAIALALAAVEQVAGRGVVAVTGMTEEESDAREGWETLPELVSVTEAADALDVSRQAVLDRISRGTLPATKIGRDYAIPRAAVASRTSASGRAIKAKSATSSTAVKATPAGRRGKPIKQ